MTAYQNLNRDYKTNSPYTVDIFGEAGIGLDGEVTTQTARGATVAKVDDTGRYRIVLDVRPPVPDIFFPHVVVVHPSQVYLTWITKADPLLAEIHFRVYAGLPPAAVLLASGAQIFYRIAIQNREFPA